MLTEPELKTRLYKLYEDDKKICTNSYERDKLQGRILELERVLEA